MQLISRNKKTKSVFELVINRMSQLGKTQDYSYEQVSKEFDYSGRNVNPEKLLKFRQKVMNSSDFLQSFKQYTNQVLPTLEEQIETQFIQDWVDKVDNDHVKKLIIESYRKRKLMVETEVVDYKLKDEIDPQTEIYDNPQNIIFSELDYDQQSVEDIGLFTEVTNEELEKYFDINHSFDKSYEKQIDYGKGIHIQNTREAFIMSELIKFNYSDVSDLNLDDFFVGYAEDIDIELFKESLDYEFHYLSLFKLLSNILIDELQPYRNNIIQVRLFNSPHLFEKLVTIVLLQTRYHKFREIVLIDDCRSCFQQILQQIFEKVDPAEANSIHARKLLKKIGCFEITKDNQTYKIDLMQCLINKEDKFRPKRLFKFGIPKFHGQNSGVLMWGQAGSGKSWFLNYLNMFSNRMNSITLFVQSARDWTQNDVYSYKRYKNGLFLQFEQAVRFLNLVKRANQEVLEEVPVNLDLYGMIDISGVHKNDIEPVPNKFDERRQVHFNESDKFLYDFEIQEQIEWEYNLELILMSRNLKEPKNLMEIVQYGIDNQEASINAIGELLEQLYNLKTHQTIILIDEYNWFFRPSALSSFRYENSKELRSKIPPQHLALCRLFLNFDGHRIKNGYKICATGNRSLFNHQFSPEKIYFGKNYDVRRDGLQIQEYYNFIQYLQYKRIYEEDPTRQNPTYNQIYMESQGNQFETIKLLEGGSLTRKFRR